jgi:osmotically-inducible protein OsmY
MSNWLKGLLTPTHPARKQETGAGERLRYRLLWDRRVSSHDIHVQESDGIVRLSGVVDSFDKLDAAERIARSTLGVRRVKSKLEIDPFLTRPDDEITMLAEKAIRSQDLTEGESIRVSVKRGVVTLSGVVASKEKKAFASGAVWKLSGIADCSNQIKIDRSVGRSNVSPFVLGIQYPYSHYPFG